MFNAAHLIYPQYPILIPRQDPMIDYGVNLWEKCLCLGLISGQEGNRKHTSFASSSCGWWMKFIGEWEGNKEPNEKDRTETGKDRRWQDIAREVEDARCCFLKAKMVPQQVNMQVKQGPQRRDFWPSPTPHKASFTKKMLAKETVDPTVVVWKTSRMQSYNRILGKWGHCICLDMQLRREKDLKTLQKKNILSFLSGEGNHWPWLQVVYKVRVWSRTKEGNRKCSTVG